MEVFLCLRPPKGEVVIVLGNKSMNFSVSESGEAVLEAPG